MQAAMPENCIKSALQLEGESLRVGEETIDLGVFDSVHVFGSGKASIRMAQATLDVLGSKVSGGVLISNVQGDVPPLRVCQGAHPVPDEKSVAGATAIRDAMKALGENDFYLFLLSGGNSALCELPMEPLTLAEFQDTTKKLLGSGAEIQEMNTIRKHLSQVKGGRLADLTPAKGVVLVLSDVIGDDFSFIGSGPLYHDTTTFKDCAEILTRYRIMDAIPATARDIITKGVEGTVPETPDAPRTHVRHILVGSNMMALKAAEKACRDKNITCTLHPEPIRGEAREIALKLLKVSQQESSAKPHVHLFGGETTVTLKGNGRGGRNQEMTLAALKAIQNSENVAFLSGGTDGIDGLSDAAGAAVDAESFARSRELGLDIDAYLDNNDSGTFFEKSGDGIITGPSGTNVMDVTIVVQG